MYAVSKTWAAAQEGFIAPEGLIEISCYVPALKNTLVYTKKDLLSFTHRQTGSLVSGELPKNHIEFSLDNSDGRWNPSNPRGLERYLTERLKVTLRYGYIIDGVENWIPGGVFYLSEWRASPNGLVANFTARDVLEYMIDTPFTGSITGTLYDIAQRAIAEADVPNAAVCGQIVLGRTRLGVVSVSDELKKYTVENIQYDGKDTVAVILQKCANAAKCVIYQDRDGVLRIGKLLYKDTDYVVSKRLSYTYPEVEFSRPIKKVAVTYFDGKTKEYPVSDTGETQTLNNDFVKSSAQASNVAKWISDSLRSRQKVSGDFRGDPRLDLFDVVSVESKYSKIVGVVLTDIKVSFTGAFRIAYSGYVHGDSASTTVYCGEIFTGEGV
jgi:hypothetical protein